MKRRQSKKRYYLSNQKIYLDSCKIRLLVSKTGRLVDRKMLESNPDLGVLYYHITSSSKQLSMNKMGIFLILIFAQVIKQQYLRQFEGLPSQRYSIPLGYQTQILTVCCIIYRIKNFYCLIVRRKRR